jgi:hypothetical protein
VASWSSRVAVSHAKKLQYLCCSRIDDDDAGYRDMRGGGRTGTGTELFPQSAGWRLWAASTTTGSPHPHPLSCPTPQPPVHGPLHTTHQHCPQSQHVALMWGKPSLPGIMPPSPTGDLKLTCTSIARTPLLLPPLSRPLGTQAWNATPTRAWSWTP